MPPILMLRVLASLGFLFLSGATALVTPPTWATLFGLRTDDTIALAFVRVAGIREIVLATVALVVWRRGIRHAASSAIGLSIFIGVVDFVVVLVLRGHEAIFNLLVFHAGGIILLATTWLSLRRTQAAD